MLRLALAVGVRFSLRGACGAAEGCIRGVGGRGGVLVCVCACGFVHACRLVSRSWSMHVLFVLAANGLSICSYSKPYSLDTQRHIPCLYLPCIDSVTRPNASSDTAPPWFLFDGSHWPGMLTLPVFRITTCSVKVHIRSAHRICVFHVGTGSVGLEALSRGAHEAHFIELDAWVVKTVLKPNVTACRMDSQAVVHGGRAESFLAHSSRAPQYAPAPFDFIRWVMVCALVCICVRFAQVCKLVKRAGGTRVGEALSQ